MLSIGINRTTLSSSQEIKTLIKKPTPSSPSNDHICEDNSPVLSSWLIFGVVFLVFTNLITIIVLIISCLWFQRRKYEKL